MQTEQQLAPIKDANLDYYFDQLLMKPLPKSLGADNAIEQRHIYVIARQRKGKSNGIVWVVNKIADYYGPKNLYVQRVSAENFSLLLTSKWKKKPIQVLICEDLTEVDLTKEDLIEFFRIGHRMFERTGLREGMCIILFSCHRIYGTPLDLRSDYDGLIFLNSPKNKYDRNFVTSAVGKEGLEFLDNISLKEKGPALLTSGMAVSGKTIIPRIEKCLVPIYDIGPKDKDEHSETKAPSEPTPLGESLLLVSVILAPWLAVYASVYAAMYAHVSSVWMIPAAIALNAVLSAGYLLKRVRRWVHSRRLSEG